MLYGEGILCVLCERYITFHNVYEPHYMPLVIERSQVDLHLENVGIHEPQRWQLLHYSNSVLVLSLDSEESCQHLLLAIDLKRLASGEDGFFIRQIPSNNGLFVRHDGKYLYYGTHSRIGTQGHHEWVIRGFMLDRSDWLPDGNHIQLEDFVGSEIGVNVAFKIHDGYFYAVSNQTSFVMEEIDWTSFYTVMRFPLDNPVRDALEIDRKIFRRQHAEGPIHDSWTDLSLQHDEETNSLMIVESRREWQNCGSIQTRTFYTKKIYFHKKNSGCDDPVNQTAANSSSESDASKYPEGDKYVNVLDSTNNAFWGPTERRKHNEVHPEYGRRGENAQSFILAKTKFRAYNISCRTFLDLVEDENCCGTTFGYPSCCLRLRIGSREPRPLRVLKDKSAGAKVACCSSVDREVLFATHPSDWNEHDQFRYSRITLWPPVCDREGQDGAHASMNPHLSHKGKSAHRGYQVTGFSDERSLVYMVRPSRPRCKEDEMGYIVVVAFDPYMAHDLPSSPSAGACWQRPPVKV